MTVTAVVNALIVFPPGSGAGEPRQTTLRFDQRRVVSVDSRPQRGDKMLDLDGYMVYPGLVNAHDHLEMNHYPRTKFREVYANASQWAADFTPQLDHEPFRSLRHLPLAEQCRIGVEKNVRAGVTTVAHHNPFHRPLRHTEGLRVVQRYGWAHSFALETEATLIASYRRTPRDAPWCLHLAEGTDQTAAEELDRLDRLGLLQPNTVLIHGVGLAESDRAKLMACGAGLVWCPSSNYFLLGRTAEVETLAQAHRLALGSDSRLTADGDLLDELRSAFATQQLTAAQLFRAATIDAARMLHVLGAGDLAVGCLPDLFAIKGLNADPYRALIDLRANDITIRCQAGQYHLN